jgi:hypothetical protein
VTLGKQQADGTSKFSGLLDAEARATFEAVFAKWAGPGMCNPDDAAPCVDGSPTQAHIDNDQRSPAQRNHDALKAMGRSVLTSGELGQHNGLPATIVVSTTLQELESGIGHAVTGGGTLLPMSDVIRLASNSHHYLVIYDKHTQEPLYLGRTKRLASAGQCIVLQAQDRGCTFPGCTVPAYGCQVHHAEMDWAKGGNQHHRRMSGLRPPQPPRQTRRLAHPKTQRRPHRMDPTTTTRQRAIPGERLPPPRELPTTQRRRKAVGQD